MEDFTSFDFPQISATFGVVGPDPDGPPRTSSRHEPTPNNAAQGTVRIYRDPLLYSVSDRSGRMLAPLTAPPEADKRLRDFTVEGATVLPLSRSGPVRSGPAAQTQTRQRDQPAPEQRPPLSGSSASDWLT